MGVCSSCLGSRVQDLSDGDDSSRLLFEDDNANNYGSFGDPDVDIMQADPHEVQRENEALQKVVIQTSNHLVDIFAVASQDPDPAPSAIFSGQDARLLRYREVLARLSTAGPVKIKENSLEPMENGSDGWVSGEEDAEDLKTHKIPPSDVGPLFGGLEDELATK